MTDKLRKKLSYTAQKPDYIKKDRFIRSYRKKMGNERTSSFYIIRNQLAYISPSVWLISAIALAVAIIGIYENKEAVFAVSVIMPFVSGIAVLQAARSRLYAMSEMESVTFISVRGILFARFVCIGVVHITLLAALSVIVGTYSGYGIMMCGAVIIVPYLLSSVGGMEVERTTIGRKSVFGSLSVAAFVSVLMIVIQNEAYLLEEGYEKLWYITVLILALAELVEIKRTFSWEEYAWN